MNLEEKLNSKRNRLHQRQEEIIKEIESIQSEYGTVGQSFRRDLPKGCGAFLFELIEYALFIIVITILFISLSYYYGDWIGIIYFFIVIGMLVFIGLKGFSEKDSDLVKSETKAFQRKNSLEGELVKIERELVQLNTLLDEE